MELPLQSDWHRGAMKDLVQHGVEPLDRRHRRVDWAKVFFGGDEARARTAIHGFDHARPTPHAQAFVAP